MSTFRLSLSSLLKRISLTLAALLLLAPLGTVTLAAASPSAPKSGSGPSSSLNESTNTTVTEEEEEAEAAETEEATEAEAAESEAAELEEEEAEAEAEEEGEEASSGTRSHTKADAHRSSADKQTGSAAKVSKLALTAATKGVLTHGRPAASNVGVSFALSSRTKVHFVLARQDSIGTSRWQTTSSVSIAAIRGSNEDHLHGASKLAAGHYRLTLTPSGGHSQQVTFEVR